jgi:phage terminase large subunit-like protein
MMHEPRDPAFESAFQASYDSAKVRSATLAGPSLAERFAALPADVRARILAAIPIADRARLLHAWGVWSRPKQRVPDVAHRTVLWLGGRGMGKNRSAAERVREKLYMGVKSVVMIGATWREVLRHQVGGKLGAAGNGSGLLDVFPAHEREQIEVKEQRGELIFPWLGATVYLVSDETPELRGGSYGLAYLDEVCKWRHLQRLWDNLEFTMRVRSEIPPEIIVTTTPRPMRWLKELIADPDTITILGTTDENAANLDRGYIARLDRKYGGSRIARQERGGEILTQNEAALFHQDIIDATRVTTAPPLVRVVVAIDPAISTTVRNDETGIVAMGLGHDGHLYILAEASGRLTPEAWGAAALKLYDQYQADAFVGERNRGGDLVAANMRATIREKRGPHAVAKIIEVHATRNKAIRAEPVATLHEQGRLHFVGVHPEIEQEITEFDPSLGGVSPNRLDAIVWGAFELAKLGEEIEAKADPRDSFKGIRELAAGIGQAPSSSSRPLTHRGVNIATLLGGARGGIGGRI